MRECLAKWAHEWGEGTAFAHASKFLSSLPNPLAGAGAAKPSLCSDG